MEPVRAPSAYWARVPTGPETPEVLMIKGADGAGDPAVPMITEPRRAFARLWIEFKFDSWYGS